MEVHVVITNLAISLVITTFWVISRNLTLFTVPFLVQAGHETNWFAAYFVGVFRDRRERSRPYLFLNPASVDDSSS